MRQLRLFVYLLIPFMVLLESVHAQGNVATGQTFGSYGGGPDAINLGNLNSQLTIPIRHKAGRGTDFDWTLNYNSSVWTPVTSGTTTSWQPVSSTTVPGWQGLNPAGQSFISYGMGYAGPIKITCNGEQYYQYETWTYGGFYYYDANGQGHSFGHPDWSYTDYYGQPYPGCGPTIGYSPSSAQESGLASDGSGFTMYANPTYGSQEVSAWIVDKNGMTINAPIFLNPKWVSQSTTDSNGNQITSSNGSYTDTLGQPVLNITGAAPSNTTYTYTAPYGVAATYTVKYTTYTVQTKFGCTSPKTIAEYGPKSMNLVSEIDLPDGSKYIFGYEKTPNDTHNPNYVTGRVTSITLPTGGTISYAYTNGNLTSGVGTGNIVCVDGSTAGLTRTTNPGGIWTYKRGGTSPAYTTTVLDPLSDQTTIQFQEDYGNGGLSSGLSTFSFWETERQVSNSSGTLLQTVTTCYNGNTTACPTTHVNSPISQRNVTTQLGNGGYQDMQIYKYNSNYGTLMEEDDYDYAAGTPTTVLKRTYITYAIFGGTVSVKPATVTICTGTGTASSCNSAGTVVAQTTYTYDQGTPATSSNTPQHIAVGGSRENVTTIASLVSGSTTLNKTFTYWDTGMVNMATDVNSALTTYSYQNATSTCGNAFATGSTVTGSGLPSAGLSRSYAWNCLGGVQTSVIDENGNTTSASYTKDPYYWRPESSTDATNVTTNYCYGLWNGTTCTVNPNQVESLLSVNSNTSVNTLITSDGVGRPILQQKALDPSLSYYDTVETDYDSLGRVIKVTLPFKSTEGATNSGAPGTSTQYDAMGRVSQVSDSGGGLTTYTPSNNGTNNDVLVKIAAPTGENSKQRQLEFNGLGQLTSVCEVTNATQSGSCGQSSPQTGYWTQYTYDVLGDLKTVGQNVQNGTSQSRSYSYDGLGRMTSETNPEIGPAPPASPTPINYTYDTSASPCTAATYSGDLVMKVDPQGTTTCFAYDALHRNTSITYSGGYASVTPNKYFVYDAATVNGTKMTNVVTRLAEAYTGSSKTTDLGFSYTARGEVSDVYQLTPHSSPSYYHVSQTYWPHGSPSQLSATYNGSAITGLPTISYGGTINSTVGLDGEGRITQVTAGTGQNPVTGVNYNPYGTPPQQAVTFGSGDSDVFNYDPQTFRMTQYQFNVGTSGLSDKGILTWNANSTLQQLAITDGFPSTTDTQTCTYGYDDMVRIASANCGSVAGQTFTYDPFGNIDKSGSPYSFSPVYTNTRNRISTVGSTTAQYDNNGNVLNDGVNTLHLGRGRKFHHCGYRWRNVRRAGSHGRAESL